MLGLTAVVATLFSGDVAVAGPATTFQSTDDESFRVQVPEGWVIRDLNNTGSALLEETRQGYGIIAQLCPEEEQQQQAAASLSNASGDGNTGVSCELSENDVIHIVRYPDLDTRLLSNNVTFDDNMTIENILSYHLQKLQEVGYRSIQLVNSTDMTLNVANPQTNETIATVPAKLVEMTYSTNFAPNEIRTGYFISTATNATTPNPGTTKGYAIFYEGNTSTTTTAGTPASGSLLSPLLPPAVGQVFDSFELLAAAELAQEEAQTAETAVGGDFNDGDDNAVVEEDDNGADDDGNDGGNGDDDGRSSTNTASSTSSSSGSSRCPDGYHRSPSGDCERVTDTRGMPRCPDGYHRSPSGNCEYVG